MQIAGEHIALASLLLAMAGAVTKSLVAIGKLVQRITVLETKTELFWGAVGKTVSDLIKQPIHFRKDQLVDEFNTGVTNMPDSDLEELRTILADEIKELETNKDPKSLAYALLRARIEQVQWIREHEKKPSRLSKMWSCMSSALRGG